MPELAQETLPASVKRESGRLGGKIDPPADRVEGTPLASLVEDEMLVEEISIDGMCGVY
ncbi:MAG: mycofactocin precursor MftA [Acidimicrobiales bacterium]|jgi:mycofactocin precursor